MNSVFEIILSILESFQKNAKFLRMILFLHCLSVWKTQTTIFAVSRWVPWPLDRGEAGSDLVFFLQIVLFSHANEPVHGLVYSVFSPTWPASMQIYWNKRKRLHEKGVQLPKDLFGTQTWPPFHCFGTQIWPPWRHVKTHNMRIIHVQINSS